MDGKTRAIIAHITIVGWIIALVINKNEKDEFASFYIRQTLGIMLLALVLGIIPVINFIAWIIPFVLWILSLINSIQRELKPSPVVDTYFQDWFKSL